MKRLTCLAALLLLTFTGALPVTAQEAPADTDLSQERFSLKDGKYFLYAGEAVREIFLISLLYMNLVESTAYSNIDYDSYLEKV